MVESVVVGICLDKVCECITDFIGAHSCVSDAPAQFHSSVDLVDAATTGLLPSATVGVPVAFLADKFYTLLVLHLEVTDAYVAHIQHRNEPLGTFIAYHTGTFLRHPCRAVLMEAYVNVQINQ